MTPPIQGEEATAEQAWIRAIDATQAAVRDTPSAEYRVTVDETVATVRPGSDPDGSPDTAACRDALAGLGRAVLTSDLD
ncbi:MAG: hypothetical protein L0I76_23115 [Pseudonocardia sp.]|nr:hypothetical protein [Pseudonocardia sp.]